MIDGKTKTITRLKDPGKLWSAQQAPYPHLVNINTKNRLTANDAVKDSEANVATYKTDQTCDVFRYLDAKSIPTAFISQQDGFNFVARECEMIPYECVARRRAWGSYLKRNNNVNAGHVFGKGINGRYQDPLVEFFYKHAVVKTPEVEILDEETARQNYLRDGEWTVPVYTDPAMIWAWADWRLAGEDYDSAEGFKVKLYPAKESQANYSTMLAEIPSLVTPNEYMLIKDLTIKVFMALEEAWSQFNVELVDMKIEFGRDLNTGYIIVADVIDNDSWRIWPDGDSEKQLDKQSFRDGEDLDVVTEKYRVVTDYTKRFKI
jgi:phosphoribosylaminoimidazole-succinocarboxamide synthase